MDSAMTPSSSKSTTAGQIDKAVSNYRAMLEKHASEFDSETVQIVLGQPELANEQLAVFRRRVETLSGMIIRRVKVNRSRTPQQALAATGRRQYTNSEVVAEMPRYEGEEVDVCFFPLKKYTSVDNVDKMLAERGLKPDPYAVAAVNEADPAFADSHPNGTQWKDSQGRHCYVTFNRWYGERELDCHRLENDWHGHWCLGGVRK